MKISRNSQTLRAKSQNQEMELANLTLTKDKLKKRVEMFHRYNNLPSNIFAHDFQKITIPKKTNKFFQLSNSFSWRFFVKTFFSSWWNLLVFVLLLAFVIAGLSTMFLSQHSPTQHIGHNFGLPRDWVLNLPSSLSPEITKKLNPLTDSQLINQIHRLAREDNFSFTLLQPDTYTFDIYSLLTLTTGQQFFSLLGTNHLGEDIFTKTLFSIFTVFGFWIALSLLEIMIGFLIGLFVRLSGRQWIKKSAEMFVGFTSALPLLLYFLFVSYLWGVGFGKTLIIIAAVGWITPFKLTNDYFNSFESSSSQLKTTKLRVLISQGLVSLLPKMTIRFFARLWQLLVLLIALAFFGISLSSESFDLGTIIRDGMISFQQNYWSFLSPLLLLYLSFVIFKLFENSLLNTMKSCGIGA